MPKLALNSCGGGVDSIAIGNVQRLGVNLAGKRFCGLDKALAVQVPKADRRAVSNEALGNREANSSRRSCYDPDSILLNVVHLRYIYLRKLA